MKKVICLAVVSVLAVGSVAMADTFGSGDNQFTLDFVPIPGDAGDLGSWAAGSNYTFSGVNSGDYRMGKFEITNAQFAKFASNNPFRTRDDVPSNRVSWLEAAQFVNWLNTENGHQKAYNFNEGTFSLWDASDAWGGTNLYRHKDAYYFLPTEDEWVKAAYWNGTNLQTYATKAGESLHQGDGDGGTGWNYWDDGYAYPGDGVTTWPGHPYPYVLPFGLCAVGSGSEELNGTFDMMGNVGEWLESPYFGDFLPGSSRGIRGGAFSSGFGATGVGGPSTLASSFRFDAEASYIYDDMGFRVASIPEPFSLVLLGLGGLALRYRKR